jgi:hypothetical protein
MLSEDNIDRINRQIESELRDLRFTRDERRRQEHFKTIKELKSLLDEPAPQEKTKDEIVAEAVREILEMFRR